MKYISPRIGVRAHFWFSQEAVDWRTTHGVKPSGMVMIDTECIPRSFTEQANEKHMHERLVREGLTWPDLTYLGFGTITECQFEDGHFKGWKRVRNIQRRARMEALGITEQDVAETMPPKP